MRLKRDSATRILGIGNRWWVGKEVCCVLGIKNHRQALSRLDDDEKCGVVLNDAIGRPQQTLMVNEPGLYHLLQRSRKKAAKTFKKWVRKDISSQIHKKCKLWGKHRKERCPDTLGETR